MNALHQTLLKHITPDADGLMTVERDDEDVLSLSSVELTRYSQWGVLVVDSTVNAQVNSEAEAPWERWQRTGWTNCKPCRSSRQQPRGNLFVLARSQIRSPLPKRKVVRSEEPRISIDPLVPGRSLNRRGEGTNAAISLKAIEHPHCGRRPVRRTRLCVAGVRLSPCP